jgi:hypothetical protein
MSSPISIAEFKDRLAALCLKGGQRGFPRKPRDRHILFKSIILMLETQRTYTEAELNEELRQWLSQVGQTIELDHVSLRRYLVDAGYLIRDGAGRSYQVALEQTGDVLEPGIETLDPVVVLAEVERQLEAQKQAYLSQGKRS